MLGFFRKKIFKKEVAVLLVFIVAVFLFSANFVHAQELGINYAANIGLQESSENDVRDFIVNVVKYFITFLGIIAVVVMMYAGFLWMTSGGDPEKLNKAKKTLVNAVIGLIIVLFSFAIVVFIVNLMNGNIKNYDLGPGKRPQTPHGYGAIGACSVESVYPEPDQKDVPRDTVIVITFKEEVDFTTIADNISGTTGDINTDVLRIFHTNETDVCIDDDCASLVESAQIATNDNYTFIIYPNNYLGSPSEYIWYTVYLNNDANCVS